MSTTQQEAWVARVLGVAPSRRGDDLAAFRAAWARAADDWRSAIETVDAQIASLQSVLRGAPDPVLQGVAELGMNEITGNHKVRVMAAVQSLGTLDRGALAKNGPAAMAVVTGFSDHLAADPRVALCDDNPFGVSMTIRATLTPALAGLAKALQQSGAASG